MQRCVHKPISSSLNLVTECRGVGVNIMPGEREKIKTLVGQF